jgi:pseudouridine-5'-phosphate glycosidase
VFVELEIAPWVWRVSDMGVVHSHIGQSADVAQAVVDELGWLYLVTDIGFGVVHTLDVGVAAAVLEEGRWPLVECPRAELPSRFVFVRSPQEQWTLKKPT